MDFPCITYLMWIVRIDLDGQMWDFTVPMRYYS